MRSRARWQGIRVGDDCPPQVDESRGRQEGHLLPEQLWLAPPQHRYGRLVGRLLWQHAHG
eukprot:47051-Prymnesium_polylepis.1